MNSLVWNERDWAAVGGKNNGRCGRLERRFLLSLKHNSPEGIVDDWESAFEIFNDSVNPAVRSEQ
jgi:hypothetical protein